MTTVDSQPNGRYLSPEEIGDAVVWMRDALGMKQWTLATEARVSERTVQRLESGKRVDQATLEQVARVLGFKENYFLRKHIVMGDEETKRRAQALQAKTLMVDAHRLETLMDAKTPLGYDVIVVDDRAVVTPEAMLQAATFRDYLNDYNDCIGASCSQKEELTACQFILNEAMSLEALGYVVFYCRYRSQDSLTGICILIVLRNEESLRDGKQMLVPGRFTQDMHRNE